MQLVFLSLMMVLYSPLIFCAESSPDRLSDLPDELNIEIRSFLTPQQKEALSKTNKHNYRLYVEERSRKGFTFDMEKFNRHRDSKENVFIFLERHKDVSSLTIKNIKPDVLWGAMNPPFGRPITFENLHTLNMEFKPLRPRRKKGLGEADLLVLLCSGMPRLSSLTLKNCDLGEDIEEIGQMTSHLRNLTFLYIDNSELDDSQLKEITKYFQNISTLKIRKNRISREDIREVCLSLPNLRTLDISHNKGIDQDFKGHLERSFPNIHFIV